MKIIEEIVIPYVEKERERLDDHCQAALLVLDVFRGQMTSEVTDLLKRNNIFFVTVPSNMTHLFQPLDLTVNGHCKSFMKKKFAEWFAQQFDKQLSLGKKVEDIEMKFRLTEIKPVHAHWITQFYNHMSTEEGSKIVINGWKRSGIFDAIARGSSSLPSIDPFETIDNRQETGQNFNAMETIIYPTELAENFLNDHQNDEDSDWDNEDEFDRNAFDFIIDDDYDDGDN